MTLEAKEYEFDNVIEDVKKVNFEKFPQFNGLSDLISLFLHVSWNFNDRNNSFQKVATISNPAFDADDIEPRDF